MALHNRLANLAAYNSVYLVNGMRVPLGGLHDPATWSCWWAPAHWHFSKVLHTMADVVQIWVLFFNQAWLSGCLRAPAMHMSHETLRVLLMIFPISDWWSILEPAGCSRWKWKVSPLQSWSRNMASHRSKCTFSARRSSWICLDSCMDFIPESVPWTPGSTLRSYPHMLGSEGPQHITKSASISMFVSKTVRAETETLALLSILLGHELWKYVNVFG